MIFKRYELNILLRVLLLFASLTASAWLLVKESYVYEILVCPVIILQFINLFRFHKKTQDEIDQFVEAIHYKDFTRNFSVHNTSPELKTLRTGFNEINAAFKLISREKETQYQYLQKILELVDTGILSYEIESGLVIWMNESLKRILEFPYLRTIQSLDKRDPELCMQIVNLAPGERIISTIHREKSNLKVVLSATAFHTDDVQYKLIAFQNVNEALDETESKAWQKLLSVMTHEIMNSVAPIFSLADTLQNRVRQLAFEIPEKNALTGDLELGIGTIKKRSEGLLKFTETYRNLNRITKANTAKVYISELLEHLHRLMQPTLAQKKIPIEIILKDPLLAIEADSGLIEQVLINLVLNAIDAVKNKADPRIVLSAYTDIDYKAIIKLTDNGTGMTEDLLDKIFIPFFSTKKNGNGIGLSLCKQIMLIHKATIQVQSKENEGTVFTLRF